VNNPPDRFAPPGADVADIPRRDGAPEPERPRAIGAAMALLLASIVLGFISLLPGVNPPQPLESLVASVVVWIIVLGLTALQLWLMRCVWQRLNWARWVLVALILLGLALSLSFINEELTRAPLVAMLNLAGSALDIVAGALLLIGAGARWFNPQPPTSSRS
jgi:hypothetical protein